jgi:hypothetical protein
MTLKDLVSLEYYVPTIYKDVKEIDALIKSEDYLFDILISIVDKEYARMFIQTSDEIGVLRFENILEITADPTIETLEFRKERLLTRCNTTLPYSAIWLRIYLNAVLGQYNYELNIDYKKRIIRLYGYVLNYNWAREATKVINSIKPCNMVFINIPTMIESVGLIYWWDNNTWNSSNWNDDNTWNEYEYLSSEELVNYSKESQTSQDFQTLLNSIGNIRLNYGDEYNLSNRTISVSNDTIFLEFNVPEEIKLLEHVEILDKGGNTLVETACYIDTPVGTQIIIRLSCYSQKGN